MTQTDSVSIDVEIISSKSGKSYKCDLKTHLCWNVLYQGDVDVVGNGHGNVVGHDSI